MATVEMGLDLMLLLHDRLAGVIGLSPRAAGDKLSGYLDLAPHAAALGLPFLAVDDYSLRSPKDRARLESLSIEVLLLGGWQRLIPPWLLVQPRQGALGLHGSPWGIQAGRGRSPQNWALILEEPEFEIALFRLQPGADEGPVLARRRLRYGFSEGIRSSYQAVVYAAAEMIRALPASLPPGQPQEGLSYYLPQRLPEDGALDWNRPAAAVLAFIHALSRPYPGAFSLLRGQALKLWCAQRFAAPSQGPPGLILHRFQEGSLLIRCADAALLVSEWSGPQDPQAGERLPSVSFPLQMQGIIKRHQQRWPDRPLQPKILAAAQRGER